MIRSVYHLLQETANVHKDQVAAQFYQKDGWAKMTWGELEKQVNAVSSGLIKIGVALHDRIAILAKTKVEWPIADLAILGTGCVTVPIYHSSALADIVFILNDSESKYLFVDDQDALLKCRKARLQVPLLEKIICINPGDLPLEKDEISWADIFDESLKHHKAIMQRVDHLNADDLATLVYTSGTTGEPKGSMLTHDNLLYEARAIEKFGIVTSEDIQLLFLPLAHVFAKVLQIAWLKTAHTMVFAQSIEKTIENMKEVRPTIMGSVPRIYEKVYAKVIADIESASGVKGMLGRWGLKQGEKATQKQKSNRLAGGFKWALAQKLVFSKIGEKLHALFGGRLRFFISGGASLSPDIAYFFKHSGVTILEGYGLTETTAATCVNLPSHNRIGTVGKPVPGTELQIAPDGEVLIRGRGVFKGYWNRPEDTKSCLTPDGWFRTGDIGVLDHAGFLRITDRKKEIIVNAGGKKIAPQKVENLIKSKVPLIGHVVVYGEGRPYLVALIVLDENNLKEWATKRRIKKEYTQLVKDPRVKSIIDKEIKSVNAFLASFEQIKKFAVLDHDFVIGGQLTPTLKVKRNACYEQYKNILEALYNKR
jgi:long-chain acyl-CoA synthetase